jgi:hypothetical protein
LLSKQSLEDTYGYQLGLCHYITDVDGINKLVKSYIISNMPKGYRTHWSTVAGIFGWEPGLVSPRIAWLKEHIEILSKK